MTANNLFGHLSNVEKADFRDGRLIISGWIVPWNGGTVTDFLVRVGGSGTETEKLTWVKSPDVTTHIERVHGRRVTTEHARFHIVTAPLDLDHDSPIVVALKPLQGTSPGALLVTIASTDLEPLSEDDASRVGGGVAVGIQFLGFFLQLCRLQPDERVLDVGCGVGRMAWALANYLAPDASYHGFDVVKGGIDRARDVVSSKRPNFRFDHVDLYNHKYNPEGTRQVDEFVFPYEDDSFDFIFLTSVFTHLGTRDVKHYITQMSRVMAPGGRVLVTGFLLSEDAVDLIERGHSRHDIRHKRDEGCFTEDPANPEGAVGYVPDFLHGFFREGGFKLREVHSGHWCGRTDGLTFQDIAIYDYEPPVAG